MTKTCLFIRCCIFQISLPLIISFPVYGDWDDLIELFTDNDTVTQDISLTDNEIIAGLKQALSNGTKKAINHLGRPGGYFENPRVKIPMPDSLEKVEDGLRAMQQDKLADDFVLTMNSAAEQAVPEATQIFSDAIRNMSIADARKILHGPDNAATSYFRSSSGDKLADKMLPIVKRTTDNVGVTAKYKAMIDNLGFISTLVDTDSLDIDQYVTDKAMDGLFKMLAKEEKKIRTDPAARTTELLKKVFMDN